jgi:hypothetical protein
LKPEGKARLTYSLEVGDIAGNRLRMEQQPLKRSEPESVERDVPEEKAKIWIEDF